MDSTDVIYQKAQSQLLEFLTENRMRKTPERFEVLKAVCGMTGIFSIDDLAQNMQADALFQVSRVTIFNSLETFIEAQLVIKHTLRRAALYECNVQKRPRVLLICDRCDVVKSLEKSETLTYLGTLRSRSFVVKQPVLYLHGLCKKCDAQLRKQLKKRNK